MAYIGTAPTKVVSRQSVVDYRYIATEGQTAFTGADLNNQVLACNPADMDVYLNGVRLDLTDWTATATTLTLAVAATAGDEITAAVRQTFEVADTYAKTTADDRFVNASGDTMTGPLEIKQSQGSAYGGWATALNLNSYFPSYDETAVRATIDSGIPDTGVINTTYGWIGLATRGGDGLNRRLVIDSSGRVTMPYQPAFLACKDDNSGLIGSGAYVFDDVFINTGNSYNPSTGRFTAPTTGVYWFTTTLQMWGMSVGSYCQFTFFKNGAGYPYSLSSGPYGFQVITQKTGATDYHNSVSLSGAIQLNVGDYVNVEMLPSGYARGMQSHFSGYLIG